MGRVRFGEKRPSGAAESTTVQSDRWRTDNVNHDVERAREDRVVNESRVGAVKCSATPFGGPPNGCNTTDEQDDEGSRGRGRLTKTIERPWGHDG
jgi:hypothetical protein